MALLWSCSTREDLDGSRRRPKGLDAPTLRSPRSATDSVEIVDLMAFRPVVAVYPEETLVIPMTGVALLPYTDGSKESGWRLRGARASGGAEIWVDGFGASIYFPHDGDPGGIATTDRVTIRFTMKAAAAEQLVSVFLNEHKLEDVAISRESRSYTVTGPSSLLVDGDNRLRFYFRHASALADDPEMRSAGLFEQVSIGPAAIAADALVVELAEHSGQQRRSYRSRGQARLSFYLAVPERQPRLELAVAGSGTASIRVSAAGAEIAELWSQELTSSWTELDLDLAPVAGKLVRLDLHGLGLADWADLRLRDQRPPASPSLPSFDHIIVWSVSSLRRDRLERFELPVDFDAIPVRSTAAESGSAHAAMMTGHFHSRGTVREGLPTLAEVLGRAGYRTALVSGNGFVSRESGHARGFSVYENPLRAQQPYSARILWQRGRQLLEGEKSFLYLATVEAHLPYRPTEESLALRWSEPPLFEPARTATLSGAGAATKLSQDERRFVTALYDAALLDNARAFREMLADLDELGLADRTAIILVGDHGEELFDAGALGHGFALNDAQLATALALRARGLDRAALTGPGSSVDVFATVLELAGLSPPGEGLGRSLLRPPPVAPRLLYSGLADGSRSIRVGDASLIRSGTGRLELSGKPDDIAYRCLRAALALVRELEDVWPWRRWGTPFQLREAFARDQGL